MKAEQYLQERKNRLFVLPSVLVYLTKRLTSQITSRPFVLVYLLIYVYWYVTKEVFDNENRG